MITMRSWSNDREICEREGVYIGGFSFIGLLTPNKVDGVHDTREDRIERINTAEPDWSKDEERKLVRKLDLRVLLPCCIVYFLAYLDRVNLGNVKVLEAGTVDSITTSLRLKGMEFNWAVSISYFTVTALLLPSTIVLKKYSAKNYFPCAMVLWGMIVMCMAAVKNGAGLLAARFFLGIPESGVVPCCIMYFSFWYKPKERVLRIACFHASNSVAGAVSGFLAAAMSDLNGKGGLKSWQWVFIIEGALPIVCAAPLYFCLLSFPETSPALTDRERHIALNRFGRGATRSTDVTWDTPAFIRLMTRPSTYFFFISYVCLTTVATSQATFMPSILHNFIGLNSTKSNIYTAGLYLSIIPFYILWPLHSDWTRERTWHYLLPVFVSIPCYGVWTYYSYHSETTSIAPISLYGIAILGKMVVVSQPIVLGYRSSTLYGAAEQAVGTSAAVASLSIASIIGPQVYPDKDKPLYHAGFCASLGLEFICIVTFLCIPLLLLMEAKQRIKKTGHAMPLRAMQDAENAQVSEATRARIQKVQEQEEEAALARKDFEASVPEIPEHVEKMSNPRAG